MLWLISLNWFLETCQVIFCGCFHNQQQDSNVFWQQKLKNKLQHKYTLGLDEEEQNPLYFLNATISMSHLFASLEDLLAIKFATRFKSSLTALDADTEAKPCFIASDLKVISIKVSSL